MISIKEYWHGAIFSSVNPTSFHVVFFFLTQTEVRGCIAILMALRPFWSLLKVVDFQVVGFWTLIGIRYFGGFSIGFGTFLTWTDACRTDGLFQGQFQDYKVICVFSFMKWKLLWRRKFFSLTLNHFLGYIFDINSLETNRS